MTDSERDYQTAKSNPLAAERNLIQVLSANPFLREIREARERILQRVENDDGTIIQRELTLSFLINTATTSSNEAVRLLLSQIRDQDRRCAPLRDEWYVLLKLRKSTVQGCSKAD
jgi:hypothetical protein